jgi:hypothetical protein
MCALLLTVRSPFNDAPCPAFTSHGASIRGRDGLPAPAPLNLSFFLLLTQLQSLGGTALAVVTIKLAMVEAYLSARLDHGLGAVLGHEGGPA